MTAAPTYVVAEAGVNHNGDEKLALELVDAAAAAGADAVKFQTFRAENLAVRSAPKAAYQNVTTGGVESQYDMLKRLELGRELHFQVFDRCRKMGIEFLSTPFDVDSLAFLVHEVGVHRVKIPSGEITNGPLLLQAARYGSDVILSTGMSTLGDVEAALAVLAFGYVEDAARTPSPNAFQTALSGSAGRAAIQQRVVLLHCTTEYPAPMEDMNLRAMDTLMQAFGTKVGLSDHSPGIVASVAAVARGAAIIEKHFTMDRSLPGPDHRASLEPEELRELVTAIRAVERALGDGGKFAQPSELANLPVVRKSLVARRHIREGETILADDLVAKRPGTGLSPMEYWSRVGTRARRDYLPDEAID